MTTSLGARKELKFYQKELRDTPSWDALIQKSETVNIQPKKFTNTSEKKALLSLKKDEKKKEIGITHAGTNGTEENHSNQKQ